ncbi:MAG: GYD domain-containing protein [Pseudomonadota bacterium]
MKFVFLGTLAPDQIDRPRERTAACKKKAAELGMTFEVIYYTQGVHDFVSIVDASDTYVVLGFSLWYAKQGYGRISTLPAFDEAAMDRAVEVL